ncbi:hypothetical protein ABZ930_08040 [Streptomyces sp. NPDC046716]|uniref:hypothetical protein n=1 Tax=Streptomyces sp. NPDC046716 TaxID=3157093 RepID=UPI0033ED7B62
MNQRELKLTPDGHHVVIRGRKWRATDPAVPDDVATRLRAHLMAARRAAATALREGDATAERAARDRVHAAKVALGERGTPPWWEDDETGRRRRWERGLRHLDEG